MLVRTANREDPDETQSHQGLHCLLRPFWQATIVRNFRTSIVEHLSYMHKAKLMSWFPVSARCRTRSP